MLNTSFNESEPIVNTPAQALDCFLRTRMIGSCWGCRRETQAGGWSAGAGRAAPMTASPLARLLHRCGALGSCS